MKGFFIAQSLKKERSIDNCHSQLQQKAQLQNETVQFISKEKLI